ncbi:hypothetical protein ACIBAG_01680 [Streptomyces sp. NPDC051243]|uniref:hypothetical protein n=1 Tax=Streptomyces sp. NPDC051243 TaxID=3365646 RepID=UPI0037A37FEC
MRALAEAPPQVWIAVGGLLGPATQPHVRRGLHDRATAGAREFFLDLRELHCDGEMSRGGIRALFPDHPDARFHLVGAPDPVRDCVGGDPRFTVHTRLESAWNAWSREP